MPGMKDVFKVKFKRVSNVDKGILDAIHAIMNQDVEEEVLKRPNIKKFYDDVYRLLNSTQPGPFSVNVPIDPDFSEQVAASSEVTDDEENASVGNYYEYSDGSSITIRDVIADLQLEEDQ